MSGFKLADTKFSLGGGGVGQIQEKLDFVQGSGELEFNQVQVSGVPLYIQIYSMHPRDTNEH